MKFTGPLIVAISTLSLSACGTPNASSINTDLQVATAITGPSPVATSGECSPARLTTRDAGRLNVAYSHPLAPFFVDRSPSAPVGFDVAVVNAIASGLGMDSNQVLWNKVAIKQLTAPTRQDLDLSVGRIDVNSKTDGVTLTTPYFREQQVLLARPNSSMAKVRSAPDLIGTKLGVVKGSSSDLYVKNTLVLPSTAYASSNDLKSAMRDHHVNGMIVPITDVAKTMATFTGALVVAGQFPASKDAATFALAIPTANPLITCVNNVLAGLKASGQLANLQSNWFTSGVNRTISVKE
ncbi:MAG: transporter substrate-binding domain-containing protein [Actinobacteria bacterium]|nr:transporter substrate-binding domain-containing protein [Actinomycetota bacterium]